MSRRQTVVASLPAATSPPERSSTGRRVAMRAAAGLLGVTVALSLWWLAIEWLVLPGSLLARFAPGQAFATLGRLLADGDLTTHILASLRRIGAGLALAAAIGIPVGLLLGSAPLVARTSGLVLGTARMISPLAWTPIAIILFGVGDAPVVFLIAAGAMWPIVLNTSSGVGDIDPTWLRVARSLGATRCEALIHVVWPGIRPSLLGGLRIATGLAWVILVPAEMLGVDSGLGYFILDARDRFAYDELVAAIVVIGALGLSIDTLARGLFGGSRHTGRRGVAWARLTALRAPRAGTAGRAGQAGTTAGAS